MTDEKHGDADFVMTYPCIILLTDSGPPELVEIDGVICICFFTHPTIVAAFYKDKPGGKADTTNIAVLPAHDRLGLTKLLRDLKPQLATQDCSHIAIDITPGEPIGYVAIDELVSAI